MRALGTSVMALLVVVALFWGNCFSCPQVLLSADPHGCCHRPKVPPKSDNCKTQELRNFVKAEKAAPVSDVPAQVATLTPPVQVEIAVTTAVIPLYETIPSFAVPLRI